MLLINLEETTDSRILKKYNLEKQGQVRKIHLRR